MSTETIFYTQIASIAVFVFALFGIYRLLVEQKDSVIQHLKERIADKDSKIQELESQTPDALATALSSRIENSLNEISRLKEDGDRHIEEIKAKEVELQDIKRRLDKVSELILDSDLVCKKCGAPLSERSHYPIHGHVGGREVEAEAEYIEYACGLALRDGEEVAPCEG